MKLLILTSEKLPGMVTDDQELIEACQKQKIKAELGIWNQVLKHSDDWFKQFDFAIIRTTWDYLDHLNDFLPTLRKIDQKCRILNPLAFVEWNIDKRYLQELKLLGISIVPTQFLSSKEVLSLDASMWSARPHDQVILKPSISAGSRQTFLISSHSKVHSLSLDEVKKNFDQSVECWMLQPFISEVLQGEVSLHFFSGEFSHAVKKVPKQNDFRVQEEHGGLISAYKPSDLELAFGKKVLEVIRQKFKQNPLQARVDYIQTHEEIQLMEVELIEPALYFRYDLESPKRLINAVRKLLDPKSK